MIESKLRVGGQSSSVAYGYLDTVSFAQEFDYSVSGIIGAIGCFISPDGLNMYVTGYYSKSIAHWTLATPFDLSSSTLVSHNTSLSTSGLFNNLSGVFWTEDGHHLTITQRVGGNVVLLFHTPTAWSLSSTVLVDTTVDLIDTTRGTKNIATSINGSGIAADGSAWGVGWQSTPNGFATFDNTAAGFSGLSDAVSVQSEPNTATELVLQPLGHIFCPSGFNVYAGDFGTATELHRWRLNIPWDVNGGFSVVNSPCATGISTQPFVNMSGGCVRPAEGYLLLSDYTSTKLRLFNATFIQ